MEYINKSKTGKKERPVKVIQFGEGNFLRGFADYMIDVANEKGLFDGDIVIVKPTNRGDLEKFYRQECQYTVQLRGISNKEAKKENRVITSVTDAVEPYKDYEKYNDLAKLDSLRFVISNTTEAGIFFDGVDDFKLCPPKSFPGKLTKFLYTRFCEFEGDNGKGLIILPAELIDDNGLKLKECVLKQIAHWNLSDEFKDWVENACIFASTLVDRIVTGYPAQEAEEMWRGFGYKDELIVTGEPFGLWVIETTTDISEELPLDKAGMPVIFTKDHHPYKERKVRILNGAHTSFVLASYLCGNDYVLESMNDPDVLKFIRDTVFKEIIPTLTLPKDELEEFAEAVLTRFENPYVKHAHLSIALNSVSKWRARCLPSFLEYIEQNGEIPSHLAFSLAALLTFYSGNEIRDNALVGHREDEEYLIKDDENVLEFFRQESGKKAFDYVHAVLSYTKFWGRNLSNIEGVEDRIVEYLAWIRVLGMRRALKKII